MCSKYVLLSGIIWFYVINISIITFAFRNEYFEEWLPQYGIQNTFRMHNRPIRQSFFPSDNVDLEHASNSPDENIGFKFPSQSTAISGRSNSNQWSYDLPHAIVNHTDDATHTFKNEGAQGLRASSRKPKLTAGFTKDSTEEEDGENFRYNRLQSDDESSRGLSPEAIAKISETLGAINTVGRYLVNYTRGGGSPSEIFVNGDRQDIQTLLPKPNEDLPKAIYTISKNVLGRNMTDTIAPIVKPLVTLTSGKVSQSDGDGTRPCSTPDGFHGNCEDLSNCPQLLLNLGHLRQSICFKSLFVPGVCCPRKAITDPITTDKPKPILETTATTTRRTLLLTTTTNNAQLVQKLTTASPFTSRADDCGLPQVEKFRVVGGDESLPGRWPWMAAIFLHGTRRTEFWCGGALIGPKHILTAAHCTRDSRQRPAHQFTVRLGDIDLRRDDEPSSPETYYVVEVKAHPKFSRVGFYNDIAILVLDRKVRKNRYALPVCLPTAAVKNDKFIGLKPTVVGWGTTYYGGKESTVQRQVDLPVWKNEDCDRTYFQPITENFICAGLKEGGKDACQGDSGGPLMLKRDGRWMQIGIVSFGNKCGEPGYPGVYTRVTQYLDWIQENMI